MFRSWSRSHAASLLRIEVTLGLILTALIIGLHFLHLLHAGGFWRDETSAIQLGLMPSLSQVWSHLNFDSFPILLSIVLRAWSSLGLQSDFSFRFLGLLVGLTV